MAMDLQNRKHRMEAFQEEAYFLCRRAGWVNYVAESASFHRLLLQKSDRKTFATNTSFQGFNFSVILNFIVHKSLLHAYYMRITCLLHAFTCLLHVYYVPNTWLLHAYYMSITCLLHASYTTITCVLHAYYMRITCLLHSYYMRIICLLHAYYILITCLLHVYYMPITRQRFPLIFLSPAKIHILIFQKWKVQICCLCQSTKHNKT